MNSSNSDFLRHSHVSREFQQKNQFTSTVLRILVKPQPQRSIEQSIFKQCSSQSRSFSRAHAHSRFSAHVFLLRSALIGTHAHAAVVSPLSLSHISRAGAGKNARCCRGRLKREHPQRKGRRTSPDELRSLFNRRLQKCQCSRAPNASKNGRSTHEANTGAKVRIRFGVLVFIAGWLCGVANM